MERKERQGHAKGAKFFNILGVTLRSDFLNLFREIMLNSIGKVVAILLLPFLAYGFGTAFYEIATKQTWQSTRTIPFAIGFVSFAVFWLMFKRFLQVFCTFEHELTHLLVGLLFFKVP